MQLAIELSETQAEKLRLQARELGIEPQALAAAAVNDLLGREGSDFERAARFVLAKNHELYQRLA